MSGTAFTVASNGWVTGARHVPSPNYDVRSGRQEVDLLVIHNISLPPRQFGGDFIEALFTNRLDCAAHPYFAQLRDLRVSAHFLIRRDGEVVQFVSTIDRAWHAGVSRFMERERCNDFSIGIELEGSDDDPFAPAQYRQLVALTRALLHAHPIRHIVGHQDIAPDRKTDPGPLFNWRLYREQLAHGAIAESASCSLPSFPPLA